MGQSIKIYNLFLLGFTIFILLMGFLIPHGGEVIETDYNQALYEEINNSITTDLEFIENQELPDVLADAEILGSYENDSVVITIYSFRMYNSDVFVADVYTSNATDIKSALADDTFGGSNITQTVSEMAESNDAIFAINADYASHYDEGIVIRNGLILRDTISNREAVALWADGSVSVFDEADTTAQELADQSAWQVWSFGPSLIDNSEIVASSNDGVRRNEVNNPRSAFGMVDNNHYMFVTVDGRSSTSNGVDIEELANIMLELDCSVAYNFDGGGSATMWFDGEVINQPSEGSEREVGDCVYISE